MKVLIVTTRWPFPVIGGERVRLFHIAKALSEIAEIGIVCLAEPRWMLSTEDEAGIFSYVKQVPHSQWRAWSSTVAGGVLAQPLQVSYFRSPDARKIVNEIASDYDVVIGHLIRSYDLIRDLIDKHNVIMEFTDAISLNYKRMHAASDVGFVRQLIYRNEYKRLLKFESGLAERVCESWVVAPDDAQAIGVQHRVKVIPNGVDLGTLPFEVREKGHNIAFIGNLVSTQNQDAVFWFASEILPLIRQQIAAKFRVVGNCPDDFRARIERFDGVEVTGRVKNIADSLNDCVVGVCPVRVGAGMQNKVLEYAALGLPIVTTQVGASGVGFEHSKECLVANSAFDFAEAVSGVLANPSRMRAMVGRAHERVKTDFDWKNVYAQIQSAVSEVVANRSESVKSSSRADGLPDSVSLNSLDQGIVGTR